MGPEPYRKDGQRPKLVLEAKDSFQALWFEEHLRPRLPALVDPIGTPIQVALQSRGPFRAPAPASHGRQRMTGHFSLDIS